MRLTSDDIDDSLTTFAEFEQHERILPFEDTAIGLKGFIAIRKSQNVLIFS